MAEDLHPRDLKKRIRWVLYWLWQLTWGLPQTLLGAALFLRYARSPHMLRHGAVVTRWPREEGLSLGLFVFLPMGKRGTMLFRHEFGHTVQSLLLGPLFLLLIGLPSLLWASVPERRRPRPYFSFYTEKWANRLGGKFKI